MGDRLGIPGVAGIFAATSSTKGLLSMGLIVIILTVARRRLLLCLNADQWLGARTMAGAAARHLDLSNTPILWPLLLLLQGPPAAAAAPPEGSP